MGDRCEIREPPSLSAANKGEDAATENYPDDWPLVAQNVKCRLTSTVNQAREDVLAGRLTSVTRWFIRMPAGTAVKASYRIRITTLGNRDFEVVGMVSGSDEVARVVECKEL